MNENFWILKMPGSQMEIVSVSLETGEEQPVQLQLLLDDDVAI